MAPLRHDAREFEPSPDTLYRAQLAELEQADELRCMHDFNTMLDEFAREQTQELILFAKEHAAKRVFELEVKHGVWTVPEADTTLSR